MGRKNHKKNKPQYKKSVNGEIKVRLPSNRKNNDLQQIVIPDGKCNLNNKLKYESKQKALMALKHANSRKNSNDFSRLEKRVYHCDGQGCKQWHLTSKPKKF